MANLKLGIFDIFSAILPGLPYLYAIFILTHENESSITLLQQSILGLKAIQIIGLGIVVYLIGFSTQYIAYELFKFILEKSKLWKKRVSKYPVSIGKRGDEVAKIRHTSFENYQTLNTFLALRIMCYNMFFSLGITSLSLTVSSLFYSRLDLNLVLVIVFFILFMILFLRRAVSYHEWSHGLITDSIEAINWYIKKEK